MRGGGPKKETNAQTESIVGSSRENSPPSSSHSNPARTHTKQSRKPHQHTCTSNHTSDSTTTTTAGGLFEEVTQIDWSAWTRDANEAIRRAEEEHLANTLEASRKRKPVEEQPDNPNSPQPPPPKDRPPPDSRTVEGADAKQESRLRRQTPTPTLGNI